MAQNIVKFLVRRGSDLDRQKTVLAQGELGMNTDPSFQRLFVGDGATKGGIPVASRFYYISNWSNSADQSTLGLIQPNDILFVRSSSILYALTAATPQSPLSAGYMVISQS